MQHPGIVFVNLMSCLIISFPIRAIFLSEALRGCKKFLRAISKTEYFLNRFMGRYGKVRVKAQKKAQK
ncbi:hypothetical protein EO98_16925 [Methanosarcina sp. 2.H.T.1A.6]|nr:hypothetical protein EO94_03980 [Methanosarcina sp. 2.H.T.1A.3]KKG17383.1 hypothetical protein EO97_08900 [Methanosarcina sp. 2.H.T.1A.15]KKG20742.1 hypothetical protein EO96_17970 [Methanosarcina sp. 2.H.T.1A.8]KKG22059.1 hypothetical protein EO98_16925 [Methanosarcina sp. 2.H.T.1A.6]